MGWLPVRVYDINQFMQEATGLSTKGALSVDQERVKYVTGLLGNQNQGLNTALLGTFFFLTEASFDWAPKWAIGLALMVGMIVFVVASTSWVPKYYRKRFGQVEPEEISAKQFVILLLALIALLFVGQPIARYLDPLSSSLLGRAHLLISDPSHQINLWALSFWVALLLISLLWHRRRDGQWFSFLGLLAFILIALFPLWHPGAEKFEIWKILNAGGLGLSLIVMGLYEHCVLVRALPKKVAESGDE